MDNQDNARRIFDEYLKLLAQKTYKLQAQVDDFKNNICEDEDADEFNREASRKIKRLGKKSKIYVKEVSDMKRDLNAIILKTLGEKNN